MSERLRSALAVVTLAGLLAGPHVGLLADAVDRRSEPVRETLDGWVVPPWETWLWPGGRSGG